jgi:hypothetical protein
MKLEHPYFVEWPFRWHSLAAASAAACASSQSQSRLLLLLLKIQCAPSSIRYHPQRYMPMWRAYSLHSTRSTSANPSVTTRSRCDRAPAPTKQQWMKTIINQIRILSRTTSTTYLASLLGPGYRGSREDSCKNLAIFLCNLSHPYRYLPAYHPFRTFLHGYLLSS